MRLFTLGAPFASRNKANSRVVRDAIQPSAFAGITAKLWECGPQSQRDFLQQIVLFGRYPRVGARKSPQRRQVAPQQVFIGCSSIRISQSKQVVSPTRRFLRSKFRNECPRNDLCKGAVHSPYRRYPYNRINALVSEK